eukprot:6183653-Amphidinium_carterae.1
MPMRRAANLMKRSIAIEGHLHWSLPGWRWQEQLQKSEASARKLRNGYNMCHIRVFEKVLWVHVIGLS